MVAPWQDRLSRVRQAVDSKFRDACRFVPMTSSQYSGPMPDPTRPAFDGTALLKVVTASTSNPAGSRESSWNARFVVGEAELLVDLSTNPQVRTLRVGDIVEALDRGEKYEINYAGHGERSRYRLALTRLT